MSEPRIDDEQSIPRVGAFRRSIVGKGELLERVLGNQANGPGAGGEPGPFCGPQGEDANCPPSMMCGRAAILPSVSDFTIDHIGGIMGHQVMYATRGRRWQPSEPVLWPHQDARLSQLRGWRAVLWRLV
jgi:hypothetical protein